MQNIAGSTRCSRSSLLRQGREVADRRVGVAEREREEPEHVRAAGGEREIAEARRLRRRPVSACARADSTRPRCASTSARVQ